MPIHVICPKCKKPLTAPDSMAGKKVKCPGCQAVMNVPAGIPAYQGETKLAVKTSAPPPAPQAPAPPAARGGNACPKCKKGLPEDAIICTDCGINIRTGEKLNTTIG